MPQILLVTAALCVLSFTCSAIAAPDFGAECASRLPAPRLNIEVVRKEVPVRFVEPGVLQNASAKRTRELEAQGFRKGRTHGLVSAQPGLRARSTGTMLQQSKSGHVCTRPGFDISIEIKNFEMQLSRLLAPGSCGLDEVHRHEVRHIHAFYRAVDDAKTVTQAKWRNDWSKRPQLLGKSAAVSAQVQTFQKEVADFLLDEISWRSDAYNAKIDTIEEYSRLTGVCGGELSRLK